MIWHKHIDRTLQYKYIKNFEGEIYLSKFLYFLVIHTSPYINKTNYQRRITNNVESNF